MKFFILFCILPLLALGQQLADPPAGEDEFANTDLSDLSGYEVYPEDGSGGDPTAASFVSGKQKPLRQHAVRR